MRMIVAILLAVLCCAARAEDSPKSWTLDMTQQLMVDGKTVPDPNTHDPADWVEVKEGPQKGQIDDLDKKCLKCQPMTTGSAIAMVLTSIRRDESPMPPMSAQEGWKAWADKIRNDKAVKLSSGQQTLIKDRVDKIIISPATATAIKKAVDPNYEPKMPD